MAHLNIIVIDDNRNLRDAQDLEVLRHYFKDRDATKINGTRYIDDEENLPNRSTASEEPFVKVISKATKNNI